MMNMGWLNLNCFDGIDSDYGFDQDFGWAFVENKENLEKIDEHYAVVVYIDAVLLDQMGNVYLKDELN
ncbi:hypothetical protein WICMUC_005538 [Wickerhamomyces mucosus]|uniref:Uncharacterized protein n=1 Tax=Wickerhamomyces mucosus TaxID=1378264 RepID=A0A9P8T5E9_9ASCO|nr:hypothetical protein WICMUC_005538 [Wickerhamomyces mucosus]